LSSLTVGAIGVGIASLFITPPLAVFLALVAQGILFSALGTIASAIEARKTELVCLLYNSDSSTSAYDDLVTFLDDVTVDLGFVEIEANLLVSLVMQLAPIDTLNSLYSAVGLPAVSSPVNCAECDGCPDTFLVYGTELTPDFEYRSVLVSGFRHVVAIKFDFDGTQYCTTGRTLNAITTTLGTIVINGGTGYQIFDTTGATLWSSNAYPTLPMEDVGYVYLSNGDSGAQVFECEIDWE